MLVLALKKVQIAKTPPPHVLTKKIPPSKISDFPPPPTT